MRGCICLSEKCGTAFGINVKTITPKQKLYQFGHAIRCDRLFSQLMASLLFDYGFKILVPFFCKFYDVIRLLVQPVHKFFCAGFPCADQFFSLQGFFFKRIKCVFHFFQPFIWKSVCLFCFVDLVPPVLALIFIKQVIIILPCPFVKLPLVLQSLCFSAFFTA